MILPWLVLRDFNSPLSPSNKQGGSAITNYQTLDFQDFVIIDGMEDLHQFGCHYTQTNGNVFSKFDREMVNRIWLEQHDRSVVKFQTTGSLPEHIPCIVFLLQEGRKSRKPFKFYNMCITHERFQPLVTQTQEKANTLLPHCTQQYQLKMKLNIMKSKLRQLNILFF